MFHSARRAAGFHQVHCVFFFFENSSRVKVVESGVSSFLPYIKKTGGNAPLPSKLLNKASQIHKEEEKKRNRKWT